MTDEGRAPVAIRIVRPYATEEEYLEHELEHVARSGVVLIGAQQRPDGVVLRFEVTLKGGEVLLRGEGRVVGWKAKAFGDAPGLAVRFTRLDVKSKAFADRAHLLREQRGLARSGERPSAAPASVARPPASVASMPQLPGDAASTPSVRVVAEARAEGRGRSRPPPLPARAGSNASGRTSNAPGAPSGFPRASAPAPAPVSTRGAPPSARGAPPSAGSVPAAAPSGADVAQALGVDGVDPETTYVDDGAPKRVETAHAAAKAVIAAPPRRDELLEKLRSRARGLDPAKVEAIVKRAKR